MEQGKQMRFTPDELKLIKATFKGSPDLLKLLRKVFLPEYDPKAPFGQTVDLWTTINIEQLSPADAMIQLHARNSLIMHVEAMLIQLNVLSEIIEETPEEEVERIAKDSAK